VLEAVPGSRLLLKAMGFKDPDLRGRLAQRLATLEIDPSRVLIEGPNDAPGDHLAQYHRVDLALDTYPYHGTTTTCEALWMGVPVVTLRGTRHASRVGASLLHAVGLDDLVADSPDGYVAKASALARDAARLALLRAELRPRMRASPLCDAPAFARRFERLLRGVWHHACATTPPPAG
jgi:predicted O-linked N-acetylglucosamine transferase (SPINDLY family)